MSSRAYYLMLLIILLTFSVLLLVYGCFYEGDFNVVKVEYVPKTQPSSETVGSIVGSYLNEEE